MRIAILSDIHSNLYALEAVLSDAKRRGFDLMVNLGDILYGPIAPRRTYDLLQEHVITTIRGNQDRQIYEAGPDEIADNPTMDFIHQDLGQEPMDWMRSLPANARPAENVYLCHGTPSNDLVYLLEDVSQGIPNLRQEDEIQELLAGEKASLILCGHTHIPHAVQLETGQLIVNPGSVGLQAYQDDLPVLHRMENHSPCASYCLAEFHQDQWIINQIRLPYDHEAAIRNALKRGREDWARYLKTGRV